MVMCCYVKWLSAYVFFIRYISNSLLPISILAVILCMYVCIKFGINAILFLTCLNLCLYEVVECRCHLSLFIFHFIL